MSHRIPPPPPAAKRGLDDKAISLLLRLLQGELDSDKRQTSCGVTSQVSAADQVKIVNKHNEVRQHAQSGASAMLKMVSQSCLYSILHLLCIRVAFAVKQF